MQAANDRRVKLGMMGGRLRHGVVAELSSAPSDYLPSQSMTTHYADRFTN
jgi:hypothetical protein